MHDPFRIETTVRSPPSKRSVIAAATRSIPSTMVASSKRTLSMSWCTLVIWAEEGRSAGAPAADASAEFAPAPRPARILRQPWAACGLAMVGIASQAEGGW